MNEILKVAVVVLFAVPFVYMIYDVVFDLSKKMYLAITKKAKPAVISVISALFN
ncbi:MAG: hypothetical protein H6627_08885 [Calditrichae bacterium]|nr:hypothetical protein [Calditrichota bacterium]MCB9058668.1 hypothetical protein [Calditrichia bacterium]